MQSLEVIEDASAAICALDPIRSRILAELSEPRSAATLAARIGLPRQKVNYHLRTLEEHRLVCVADTRQWGGLTERLLVATASSYVVSPAALGPLEVDPARTQDRLSAQYLIALGARIVSEVKRLFDRARSANKRLPALSIDTVIHFRSAAERAQFTDELTQSIHSLVARYHSKSAGSRAHRLVLVAYPLPASAAEPAKEEHAR